MPGHSYRFEAIGTGWQIDWRESLPASEIAELKKSVERRIAEFDAVYSRFREDSLVSEASRRSGRYTFPPDSQPLFELYHKLYTLSGGTFSPLVGNLLVDAGYDAQYSLTPTQLRAVLSWDEAIQFTYPILDVYTPVLLDVGAAGKGYLVDLVGKVLEVHGVYSYTIDAGGDILQRGDEVLEVGLEDPADASEVIGVVGLSNGSLCGSAGNRRAWEGFHHIIDAKTQKSPRHLAATWVVAESALLADALATAIFFIEPSILAHHFRCGYALLDTEGVVHASSGFPGTFFTQAS